MKMSAFVQRDNAEQDFVAVAVPMVEALEERALFAANAYDTSFAGTGQKIVSYGNGASFTSVVALPDGKILAAGVVDVSGKQRDFLVAKFNANGSPDSSFGGGTGRVFTDFSGRYDIAHKIVLASSGKFYVVGDTLPGPDTHSDNTLGSDFAVARYNANGSLDTSFNGSGKRTIDFRGDLDSAAAGAVLSDGKLLVVGSANFPSDVYSPRMAAVRLNVNGSLDTTFASGGKLMQAGYRDAVYPRAHAVAVLPGGSFVVAGTLEISDEGVGRYDVMVAEFSASGRIDTSFGTNAGFLQIRFGGPSESGSEIAVLRNGKFIVGGSDSVFGRPEDPSRFGIARVTANGRLDTTFGSAATPGFVLTDFSNTQPTGGYDDAHAELHGMVVQADGKILAAGDSTLYDWNENSLPLFGVARYTADGHPDTSFSSDGKQRYGELGGVNALAMGKDGKAIVAGFKDNKAGVARFQADASATASISGSFFNDKNGNGVKNAGEPPLVGWIAFVDSNNDGFFTPGEASAISNSSGKYTISGLAPGTYRIREVRLDGWNRTKPGGAYPLGYYDVTIAVGQAVFGKDFGDRHT